MEWLEGLQQTTKRVQSYPACSSLSKEGYAFFSPFPLLPWAGIIGIFIAQKRGLSEKRTIFALTNSHESHNSMKTLFKIAFFLLLPFSIASCEEDNVPGLDTTGVEMEVLKGGWKVTDTDTHVNVDIRYQAQVSMHSLRSRLNDAFASKAADGSLYFREDMVFYLFQGRVCDSSKYVLDDNKYIIHYDNPDFIGFYAPIMYVKMVEDQLVLYLRKSETMDLLNEDGSLDGWMSLIDSVVDDAQCEIYFTRDYDEFYDELEAIGRQ